MKKKGCLKSYNLRRSHPYTTLINKLRKLCGFGETSWERQKNRAVWAVNISFNRSIQTFPYIIKHGEMPELEIGREFDVKGNRTPVRELMAQKEKHQEESYNKEISKG